MEAVFATTEKGLFVAGILRGDIMCRCVDINTSIHRAITTQKDMSYTEYRQKKGGRTWIFMSLTLVQIPRIIM